ncbi:MAG: trimeric intracellular cation channel family protein [Pseudomonadota bacterium]
MSPAALLDFASVFVFALTGALMASRAQLDPVGFVFVACLTAVGGGTVRDVLLDRNPIFWMAQPAYLAVAAGAAGLVFFTAHLLESRLRTLLWLDSLALAIAVAAGCAVALNLGQPPVIVVLMGIVTGCLGGLMRDVVIGDVPVVLKQGELYVSAALGGALSLWAALALGVPAPWHLAVGAGVTWALRAGSLAFGWRLPTYRHGPPKT